MFSVYGKSKVLAKKKISKDLRTKSSDVSKALKESMTQSEKQAVIDKFIDEEFKQMKPKRCTHEFSTPEIMREAYELMVKDEKTFSNLTQMKKVPKLNAENKEIVSEKTGKVMMHWVPLHQEIELNEAA